MICLWLGPPWFSYWFSFTLAYCRISHEYSSLFIIVIYLIFMFSLWCIDWVGSLYANRIFMYFCISSSSWCLGRAAVCDCGTPWTFPLPFFFNTIYQFIIPSWECILRFPMYTKKRFKSACANAQADLNLCSHLRPKIRLLTYRLVWRCGSSDVAAFMVRNTWRGPLCHYMLATKACIRYALYILIRVSFSSLKKWMNKVELSYKKRIHGSDCVDIQNDQLAFAFGSQHKGTFITGGIIFW